MTTFDEREAPPRRDSEPPAAHSDPSRIDIEKLADKVYALMRAEARLDKARGCQARGR